jgi:hypothetical protein
MPGLSVSRIFERDVWKSCLLNFLNFGSFVYSLSATGIYEDAFFIMKILLHTFWDSKECNYGHSTTVGSPDIIMYIPDRQIKRIVFIVTRSYRNRCFVAA